MNNPKKFRENFRKLKQDIASWQNILLKYFQEKIIIIWLLNKTCLIILIEFTKHFKRIYLSYFWDTRTFDSSSKIFEKVLRKFVKVLRKPLLNFDKYMSIKMLEKFWRKFQKMSVKLSLYLGNFRKTWKYFRKWN